MPFAEKLSPAPREVRIAGALYLCVLGVQAWRSRSSSAAMSRIALRIADSM